MNEIRAFDNLLTWNFQVVLVTALAVTIASLMRLRIPSVKLLYWQAVLAACFALPLLRTWQRETIVLSREVAAAVNITAHTEPVTGSAIPVTSFLFYGMVLGMMVRFVWIISGLWKMRRYRREARPLHPVPSWGTEAHILLSEDVTSPVTFGFVDPVILLPVNFPDMPAAQQEAILCHEVMHVRRKDWLFTIGEELVRMVFWFQPAIWWILGEIQLSREQAVDAEVIGMTRCRDEYLDALLAVAGASPQPDLATASLFLRRRHLKQRVVSILKEVRMSKSRSFSTLVASLVFLAASCWFITGAVPLYGAPQLMADGEGVAVETNGAGVRHRVSLQYPPEAAMKHVEGTVVTQVRVDGAGNVTDAVVISGPEELRKAVLQSVLNWHFAKDSANSTRQISITYKLPPQAVTTTPKTAALAPPMPDLKTDYALKSIVVKNLSQQETSELLSRLPVHEGESFSPQQISDVRAIVHAFDEHLNTQIARVNGREYNLVISTPETPVREVAPYLAQAPPPAAPANSAGFRVAPEKASENLINKVNPFYPPLAKAARVQGTVNFDVVIAADGTMKSIRLNSGPPLLVQAAVQAVQQWVYKPTLLNGNPVEVITTIDVNFTLTQ